MRPRPIAVLIYSFADQDHLAGAAARRRPPLQLLIEKFKGQNTRFEPSGFISAGPTMRNPDPATIDHGLPVPWLAPAFSRSEGTFARSVHERHPHERCRRLPAQPLDTFPKFPAESRRTSSSRSRSRRKGPGESSSDRFGSRVKDRALVSQETDAFRASTSCGHA